MKTIKRILSSATAVLLTGTCILSSMNYANADIFVKINTDISQSDLEEMTKDMYTLDQLFAMSDEEFAKLVDIHGDIGQSIINDLMNACDISRVDRDAAFGFDTHDDIGLSGYLLNYCGDTNDDDYKEGTTEVLLKYLFGDTVNYKIQSPSFDLNRYDGWISNWNPYIWISIPDYDICRYKRNENDEWFINEDLTDEKIIETAKCVFCANQVKSGFSMHYRDALGVYPPNHEEPETIIPITTSPAETTVTTVTTTLTTTENKPQTTAPNTTEPATTTTVTTFTEKSSTIVSSTKSSETTATDEKNVQSDIEEMTKGMYTLDELFAMSDDEFESLSLNYDNFYITGQDVRDELLGLCTKRHEETNLKSVWHSIGLSGLIGCECYHDWKGYKEGTSEAILKYLLGDTVIYRMGSPSFDQNIYNGWISKWNPYLAIYIPDYDIGRYNLTDDDEIVINEELTGKKITEAAKCVFCTMQLSPCFTMSGRDACGGPPVPEVPEPTDPVVTTTSPVNTTPLGTTSTTVATTVSATKSSETTATKASTTEPKVTTVTEKSSTIVSSTKSSETTATKASTTEPKVTTVTEKSSTIVSSTKSSETTATKASTTEPKVTTVTEKSSTTAPESSGTAVTTTETNVPKVVSGDANGDNSLSVQDCSFIAQALANRKGDTLPESADYNKDGKKNVIDAMEIAKDLARDKNK